ncbi:MAG: glycosyltransferase family 2 protein [Bacteroides sp.]
MNGKIELSIIVPCYNEEDNIDNFYHKVSNVIKKLGLEYEILFVDDGSKDTTLYKIKSLQKANNDVSYISFSRNFGKESAMLAGMRNASGELVGIMDADLQEPPELIEQMIYRLRDNPELDCIAARRINRKGEPRLKSAFSNLFYKIINKVSNVHIEPGARDFRIMRARVCDAVLSVNEVSRFSKGIFAWVGFKTEWIDYENVEREHGKSKWSYFKLFLYAIDGIISFSTIPLAISSLIGLLFFVIACIMIIYIVIQKFVVGIAIEGYALLICSILLIGGIQLFCFGIMGQYIAKIFMETKKRPAYIVRESDIVGGKKVC